MVAIAVFATAIAVITVGLTEPPIVDGASQSLQASAQIEATRIETVLREARFAAFRVGGMSELRALVDGTPDADLNDKLAMTGPELASIALVDGSDIVVSTTEAPRIDPELIARATDTLVWGDAYLDDAGRPRLPLALPVLRERGDAYTLVAEMDMIPIQELLLAYEEAGETTESHMAQLLSDGSAEFITPLRFDQDAAFTRRFPTTTELPMMQALTGTETVLIGVEDYRGVPSLLALQRVEPVGWGLVVKVDEAEGLAAIRQLRVISAAAVAIAIVGMMLAIWYGLRGYERRIANITTMATSVRDGQLGHRVNDQGSDELSLIARSFDEAADFLENTIANRNAFVASVSHELRTPLTGVVGLASAMADPTFEMDEQELRETAAIVAEQGRELSTLVDDLLTSARVEAGSMEINTEMFNPVTAVELCLSEIPDFEATIDTSDLPLTVKADAHRTQQILRNLMTNAHRYGGPNKRIEISGTAAFVRISVIDDGEGVPSGSEERIFAPFERAHAQSGVTGSVGLGLKISRDLARLMDGELVYRRVNNTTTFDLALPTSDEPPRPL